MKSGEIMPDRPNILLIMSEQTRASAIGAAPNPYIQTPAIDSLAQQGAIFTSTYCTAPVCIASRCSVVLGQYAHETGCTANSPMPQERTSLMERLQADGYQTHGAGKMHFNPDSHKLWGYDARDYSEEGGMNENDDYCNFLCENGYDHVIAAHGLRSEYYYIPQPSQFPQRLHHSHWTADRSLDFLTGRDEDRPFFLWMSFIKPHPPFANPVPWNRLYKPTEVPLPYMPEDYEDLWTYWNYYQNRYKWRDQGFDKNLLRTMRAAYYAALSFVDYNIGRVLEYLRETGVLDDTLVIYTADHGEFLGDYGCFGKRSLLDPAANIPLVVRYPEMFEAGRRCNGVVSNVDIAPTCLEAAGLDPAPDHSGLSLADIAAGDDAHEEVYVQYDQGDMGIYGIVTDDFKYWYSAPDDREWLLARREGEMDTRNLAGHAPYDPVLKGLRQRLISRFQQDGYDLPLDGDDWKRYPTKSIPETPDAMLLYQEGTTASDIADRFPEGYEPKCLPGGIHFRNTARQKE